MLVNNVPSSTLHPDADRLDFEYMRHVSAAVRAWGPPHGFAALHLGGAGCTLPRHFAEAYPDSRHLVIEIDPVLAELARSWTDLPRAPRLRIRVGEALEEMRAMRDGGWDVVVRDAFIGNDTPAHLADETWWGQARRLVRPGGVVVANVVAKPRSDAALRDARAARSAFADVVALGDPGAISGKRIGNIVLVAGDDVDAEALQRYAASAPLPTVVRPRFGA